LLDLSSVHESAPFPPNEGRTIVTGRSYFLRRGGSPMSAHPTRHYLVVANQTLGGEHLLAKIRECMSQSQCAFFVVVPATPPQEHLTWTEGDARAIAERRLDRALRRFRRIGADAEGSVGDHSPIQAIRETLDQRRFDEIILSTLPPGLSRWMRLDLPSRVERSFGLPVTHLVAEMESA
jgi:hypothetical protein